MTTIVYRYGLRPPISGADLVSEQISLAHRYYNKLIEIERERRAKVRAILATHSDVAPLEAEAKRLDDVVLAAVTEIKAARKKARARAETAVQRQHVKALRALLKEARHKLREAKAALKADEAVQGACREASKIANEARKEARAQCGCYWGTYLIVEQAVDAARENARDDPHFRRWDWSGTVAVQIQHGITPVAAQACQDSRLRIAVGANPRRSSVRLRVGSDGRDAVWAEWPLIMHRPIPLESTILWAKVLRERLGGKDRWSLHLSLRLPDGWQRETCGIGTVAVDIGWRKRPDGLRVAYLCDDEGNEEEILLDPTVQSGLRKVEGLHSTRDKNLNELRPWLADWLRQRRGSVPATAEETRLPAWLAETTTHLHQWHSQARFAALAIRWRTARFDGDAEAFERLETWRHQDKHLWTWEVNLRDKCLARRKDQYRVLAARLARRYRTLVLEQFDLRTMQRHKPTESETAEVAAARLQQRDAACSELRLCLISAFSMRRGIVAEVDASLTTQNCSVCGYHPGEPWDAAKQVDHTCAKCGRTWDQDANAGRNLQARWREQFGGNGSTVTARVKDYSKITPPKASKWSKRGRHKGTARKTGETPAE